MEVNETLLPEEISEEETALPSDSSPEIPEEILSLRAEVERLRAELSQKTREQERIMEEMGEFNRLFPKIALQDVPAAVWQSVENGIPLSAAYALYEKKNRQDALYAEEINRRNAEQSAGRAGLYTAGEYFSPDEVRSMSPSEVRANYKKIRESMKKWRR